MKKIISAIMICLLAAYGAQAATVDSVSNGNWENAATWNTGVPATGDDVNLYGHSVTNSSTVSQGTIHLRTGFPANNLVLQSGADVTANGAIHILGGQINVETGATLTKGTGTTYYWIVTGGNGREGTLNVNGGTVTTPQVMYVNYYGPAGIATVNVNDGLFNVDQQVIFDGRFNGSEERINVYGGTAVVNRLNFAERGVSCIQEVTVDGGDLILTTGTEAGAFSFSAPTSRVYYESGTITFEGVDTTADFNAFTNTFNGWVDSGNLTSTNFTAAQLKGKLQFLGGDAVLSGAPRVYPVIDAPFVNLISNGDFLLSANEDDSLNPGASDFNVNGTFGDYLGHEQRTADVVDWAPYYADPDGLTLAVGTPHLVDGIGELDGTWYLDTLINTNAGRVLLNSSMNYRNGMKQEDILNGVSIDSAKTYTLSAHAGYNEIDPLRDNSTSPFTVALTDGSGTAVTNPANTMAGCLLTGDENFWTNDVNGVTRSTTVSGADLLAAGQVNVLFDLESSFVIPGFPGSSTNANDLTVTSQARVYSVALGVVYVPILGDVNKDGYVTQADVDLANSYLDGSIDGYDDAATRQAAWIAYGLTAPETLDILNLTEFDIDGNDTFDAADVAAIQALVPPLTILSTVVNGSSVSVEVGGLIPGTGYSLMKDTDLVSAPSFDVVADSITAASQTETLSDTNAVDGQAFYKIMEQ